jgi:uncharacterized protein with HEPN domain
MTQHDPSIRIRHMLDHAKEAVDLLAGKEKAALASDRVLQLALVRLVEIVGEAANRLTVEDQFRYPSIPWREIVGMRNRLAHGYNAIDLNVLWDTVQVDLPQLIDELERILR